MIYTLSHINTRNSTLGYATSKTLEYGSWTDHGSIGISTQEVAPSSPYNAIDPCLILVHDQYYLSFGSYWSDIQVVPMKADATGTANKFPNGLTQIEYQPAGSHAAEASFLYQYKPAGSSSSYFYLFWSEGLANGYDVAKPTGGAEYKVRVCRSTVVTGPYSDASGRACLSGYGETVLASHGQVCKYNLRTTESPELDIASNLQPAGPRLAWVPNIRKLTPQQSGQEARA